jgi:hypothetical protein
MASEPTEQAHREAVQLPPHLQAELEEALVEADLEEGISLDELLAKLHRS